jgi:hypothetical protein
MASMLERALDQAQPAWVNACSGRSAREQGRAPAAGLLLVRGIFDADLLGHQRGRCRGGTWLPPALASSRPFPGISCTRRSVGGHG